MPQMQMLDLGRAYSDAENVRGAQQDRELRGLQMEAARFNLDEAKKPKPLSFDDILNNHRLALAGYTEVAQDGTRFPAVFQQLQSAGVFPKEMAMPNLPPEEAQANAAQGAKRIQATLAALDPKNYGPDKANKPELSSDAKDFIAAGGKYHVNDQGFVVADNPQEYQAFIDRAQKAKGTSIDVSMRLPPQEKAENVKVGEGFGKIYVDLQETAAQATGKVARLERIGQLLEGVNTGKLTPATTQIAAVAQSVGINIDPKLGAKQAASALSNEIALQLRNPSGGAGMPGALSDKDREFLVSMTPGLGKTPEGNRLIIETAKKLAQRDRDVAKIARTYRSKNGQLDEGFYTELEKYSAANPLFPQSATTGGERRRVQFKDIK